MPLIYIVLSYLTLRYVTLRYVTLRYVTLRYVTLRYVTLRDVTQRYVTLYIIYIYTITWLLRTFSLVVACGLLEDRCTDYVTNVVRFMQTNHESQWNITSQWRCLIFIDHGSRQLTRFIFFNTPKIPQENSVTLLKCILSCFLCIKQIDSILSLFIQL